MQSDKVTIYCRRSAECSHAVFLYDVKYGARAESVIVVYHNGRTRQPLSVYLAPRCLAPAGVRYTQMQTFVLHVLPVPRGNNMRDSVGMVVHYCFWLSGGAGGEIQYHRLFPKSRNSVHCIRGFLYFLGEIYESIEIFSNDKKCFKRRTFIPYCGHVLCRVLVGSADDGFYVDCINPVFQVLLRKRVYRRYGDCAELMECDDGVPVFVMPLEQKEYFISFFYAVFRKDVSGFCT